MENPCRGMFVKIMNVDGQSREPYQVTDVAPGLITVVSLDGTEIRRMHPSRLLNLLPQEAMTAHWRKPRKHGGLMSHVWLHSNGSSFLITTTAAGMEKRDALKAWLTAKDAACRRKAIKNTGMQEYKIRNGKHLRQLINRWTVKEFIRCDEEI